MKRLPVRAAAALSLALSFAYAYAVPASSVAVSPAIAESLKPYASASKNCLVALGRAEALASEGKWKSAFMAVDDFDKSNADPFALAMKTSLALRGFVRSETFRSFGLVDLEEGQEIESLRDGEGDYEESPFDPPALADAQAAKGIAAPGILSRVLGDYYYEVLARFSGKWAMSDQDILAKIAALYAKAASAGSYDGTSLMKQAESLVHMNRGEDADAIYRQAVALEPENAALRYSRAMSLVYLDRKAEAFPEIDAAIAAYGESSERINAIALGARTAAQLGDVAREESYFAIADKDYPNIPTSGILRHMVAVEAGDKAAALVAADALVASYGSNPSVVRAMISTWYAAGDSATARDFLQRSIAKGGDDGVLGTLDFYLAILIAQAASSDADKAVALKALDDAKAHFLVSLGPDNEVYGVMDEVRNELQGDPAKAK
jgi:tetratricopeptide (TPR) repeat protein